MSKSLVEFYDTKGFYRWTKGSFKQDRVKKMYSYCADFLKDAHGRIVLDIGSGTGDFISLLAEKFPHNTYHGNDLSERAVGMHKDAEKNISWSVGDFNAKTAYEDNFFDLVIAGEVIEHLSDTDRFLEEVHRILKPGGTVLITTPNLASWLDRFMLLFGMQPFSTEVSNVSRCFGRERFYRLIGVGESISAGHLRCFTKGALLALLRHYQFKRIRVFPCHVHDLAINKIVDVILPNMSQNMLVLAQK
jgi:ubiquinone/menaquinone biosynthesis C-methylase UbiE